MSGETLHTLTDDILKLVLTWRARQAAAESDNRLDALFKKLQAQPPIVDAYAVEDEIWEAWIAGSDPHGAQIMNEAIAAMAKQHYEAAETDLSRLIAAYPSWAEAWNKRATLYFLQGRDCESLSDIRRTLELEPRHFGAVSGFAEICIRNGDYGSAAIAMDGALQINPHLMALKAALQRLHEDGKGAVH